MITTLSGARGWGGGSRGECKTRGKMCKTYKGWDPRQQTNRNHERQVNRETHCRESAVLLMRGAETDFNKVLGGEKHHFREVQHCGRCQKKATHNGLK